MGRLVYSMIASLDGYVTDAAGDIDWGAPGPAAHAAINDRTRRMGTFFYGRRMYEVMAVWEDLSWQEGAVERDFGDLWRAADKVVISSTLGKPASVRTRVERAFDATAVRAYADAAGSDVAIAGPTLAAEALRAGIVDQIELFVAPAVLGGGLKFLPDGLRADLTLLDAEEIGDGFVAVRYDVARS